MYVCSSGYTEYTCVCIWVLCVIHRFVLGGVDDGGLIMIHLKTIHTDDKFAFCFCEIESHLRVAVIQERAQVVCWTQRVGRSSHSTSCTRVWCIALEKFQCFIAALSLYSNYWLRGEFTFRTIRLLHAFCPILIVKCLFIFKQSSYSSLNEQATSWWMQHSLLGALMNHLLFPTEQNLTILDNLPYCMYSKVYWFLF